MVDPSAWPGKIADIESYKARMAAGEYTVDDKFCKFEQACRWADVPGVTDVVSSNVDPRSVRIFFVGPVLAHNLGVRDFVRAVEGDIFVSDDPESICSLNVLLFGAFRALTNALAQASQFILI